MLLTQFDQAQLVFLWCFHGFCLVFSAIVWRFFFCSNNRFHGVFTEFEWVKLKNRKVIRCESESWRTWYIRLNKEEPVYWCHQFKKKNNIWPVQLGFLIDRRIKKSKTMPGTCAVDLMDRRNDLKKKSFTRTFFCLRQTFEYSCEFFSALSLSLFHFQRRRTFQKRNNGLISISVRGWNRCGSFALDQVGGGGDLAPHKKPGKEKKTR